MDNHSSVLSELLELIQGVGPMKYSARYSQVGSQEKMCRIFVASLFPFCFINPLYQKKKNTEHGRSSSVVPSFPFIPTKHSHLLLFVEQLHQSTALVQ